MGNNPKVLFTAMQIYDQANSNIVLKILPLVRIDLYLNLFSISYQKVLSNICFVSIVVFMF